jgi:hypothetical protein
MSDNLTTGIVSVILAIIGVASLAVILSPKANTTGVIQAGGSALGNDIAVAVSPVTGSNITASLAYPSSTSFGGGYLT